MIINRILDCLEREIECNKCTVSGIVSYAENGCYECCKCSCEECADVLYERIEKLREQLNNR